MKLVNVKHFFFRQWLQCNFYQRHRHYRFKLHTLLPGICNKLSLLRKLLFVSLTEITFWSLTKIFSIASTSFIQLVANGWQKRMQLASIFKNARQSMNLALEGKLGLLFSKPTPRDSTNCVSAIIWHVTCIKTRAKNKLCLFIFLFPALFKLFFVLSF